MPRRTLFFLSFFTGIALGTAPINGQAGLGWVSVIYFLLISVGLFITSRWRPVERRALLIAVSLFTLALALGLARANLANLRTDGVDLREQIGTEVSLLGKISNEPDERETSTRLTFSPDGSYENILLVVGKYPARIYGERLRVSGKLEQPENFETDAGRQFDYVNYLSKDDIYYIIRQPKIESLGLDRSLATRARGALFAFKQAFLTKLTRTLPEPHAALLGGITIGARRGMPELWQEHFRTAGLSHIVVLSGYNITIVAEIMLKALAFLPMLGATLAGAASVIIFTLATGASSTTVRASIMALVALLARATGRVYQSLDALLLAAFCMIIYQPKILLYDLSFQLSFLATWGIIVGPPLIRPHLGWLTERLGFRELVVSTLSAQLAVLPWILYKIGQLSFVALPANLLVLTFVPLVMFLGFFIALSGFVNYFLSLPFAYLAYLLLTYILLVTKFLAAIPYAAVYLRYFPLWLTLLIYLFFIWFWQKRENEAKKLGTRTPVR